MGLFFEKMFLILIFKNLFNGLNRIYFLVNSCTIDGYNLVYRFIHHILLIFLYMFNT